MGYTINLIQRISDGAIWNGSGFREILTQDDYIGAQFIVGDPENIPNNFGGLGVGEYRVMTFLTYGNQNYNFPMINGVAFANFNFGNAAANAVDVIFTGEGGSVILNPEEVLYTARNNGNLTYLLFTSQQVTNNALSGVTLVEDFFGNTYPEYVGLFYMDLYGDGENIAGGYSRNGSTGTISALYLIVPR
jgi:hypothetical protein